MLEEEYAAGLIPIDEFSVKSRYTNYSHYTKMARISIRGIESSKLIKIYFKVKILDVQIPYEPVSVIWSVSWSVIIS